MAAKNKPYDQFGGYILFKKLESGALGELWRAGRIEGDRIEGVVALRRMNGAAREPLAPVAATARQIVPLLSGTSFAKGQVIDVFDGVPFVAHEYSGGRSLRHIVDRSRGDTGATRNPLPTDQALVIAEKVALSLATTEELRTKERRLSHGALIPQFIWITDEGEIRVAGQQLGSGMIAALKDPKIAAEIGRYFAPEYQASGKESKATEVYSLGAILFLLVTSQEPPDAMNGSAFQQVIAASKLATGDPLPDDIRQILEHSLAIDPAKRYGSVAEMKAALSSLVHGGRYSATTFNLAFYLSTLLKKEMEGESLERERESKLNLAPYFEASEPAASPAASTAAPAPFPVATSPLSMPEPSGKSKAPLAAAAAVIIAIAAGGAWMLLSKKSTPAATTQVAAASVTSAPAATAAQAPLVSQPIVVSAPGSATTGTAPVAATDPAEEQKKAFEKAVELGLQQEMMKLQSDYNKQLQKQGSKLAPVVSNVPAPAAAAPPQQEKAAPSAAQLDQQRREESQPPPQAAQAVAAAPATVTPVQVAQATPAAASAVREGDVVDVSSVDTLPQLLRAIKPDYPPIAVRQRVEGTVILTALISEKGDVLDVRVLGGERRLGLDDAAMRAMRGAKFSPAMKDGKRVKTWLPTPVKFKL